MGDGRGGPARIGGYEKTGEPDILESDLLLAAEIGKALLERNRELEVLVKSTHDALDEQTAQANFYYRQVEILRDTNEAQSKVVEQLDSQNQELTEKYLASSAECKLLQGKNARLWDLTENLEKKIEDLKSELNNLRLQPEEERVANEDRQVVSVKTSIVKPNTIEEDSVVSQLVEQHSDAEDSSRLHHEIEMMQKIISEAKANVQLECWKREELEAELEAVLQDNHALRHQIQSMEEEIKEWQNIAEQTEYYRQLALKFKQQFFISEDPDILTVQHSSGESKSSQKLSKAKSCEFLNDTRCDKSLEVKSSKLVSNILSGSNSSSFLFELDQEYSELIKRYEALLEKCKSEKLTDNPERTKKVQRAIQTLSIDFSTLPTATLVPHVSPTHQVVRKYEETAVGTTCSTCHCKEKVVDKRFSDTDVDYRKMFEEIFLKLREPHEISSSDT